MTASHRSERIFGMVPVLYTWSDSPQGRAETTLAQNQNGLTRSENEQLGFSVLVK